MKNNKASKIWLVYSAALALFIITFSFTLTNSRNLIKYNKEVEASDNTIAKLEALIAQSKSTDKLLRDFFYKKNDEDITRFKNSLQVSKDSLNSFFTQLTNDTIAANRQQILKTQLNIYGAFSDTAMGLMIANKKEINDEVRRYSYAGILKLTEYAATIYDITKAKRFAMGKQLAQLSISSQEMKDINLLLFALAVALAVYATYTYTKEYKENKRKEATILSYNAEMEDQVKKLAAANAELKLLRNNERFASIGRMAKTIAHEVRNPLTNINLAADQLQQQPGFDNGDKKILFDMMLRNSSRINDLITDLLSSTRYLELDLKPLHVHELVEGALLLAEDRIQLKKITVNTKLQAHCNVMADKEKMLIALLNIIVNAIEAMNETICHTLTITTHHDSETCSIIITDTGCGMSDEAITKLFDPYFTGKAKGMGLGLTNTQNIILAHKGLIEVASKENEGTTFTVILPVVSV